MADNEFNIELHKLAPTAVVELFKLDVLSYGSQAGGTVYFHTGVNLIRRPVVWQGITYQYIPIEMSGFEISGQGMLPTPTAKISNISGIISQISLVFNDLVGAKLTRKKTFLRFLDAINFPAGTNPDANPDLGFPDEIFYVEQKQSENAFFVEYKLVSSLELSGVKLPGRQVIASTCLWVYREADCSYAGGYDLSGNVIASWKWVATNSYDPDSDDPSDWIAFTQLPSSGVWTPYRAKVAITGHSSNQEPYLDYARWKKDFCEHRVADCKKHFGATAVLPFGNFPGATTVPR